MSFRVPEEARVRVWPAHPEMCTTSADGNNGAFALRRGGRDLWVIASDGGGWEHVSVSLPDRCPTWDEMCFVKAQFWGPEDCVLQFHPRRSQYRNLHPYCLHLWRPVGVEIPEPPPDYVA